MSLYFFTLNLLTIFSDFFHILHQEYFLLLNALQNMSFNVCTLIYSENLKNHPSVSHDDICVFYNVFVFLYDIITYHIHYCLCYINL